MRSIITTSAPSTRVVDALERRTVGPERLGVARHQRARAAEAHLGAERAEQQRVRPRDARVQDVAADGDDEALEVALLAADGERVEQRLRGVLVRAVARVDDRRARVRAATKCGAPEAGWRSTMASARIASRFRTRVEQRLALGDARRLQG